MGFATSFLNMCANPTGHHLPNPTCDRLQAGPSPELCSAVLAVAGLRGHSGDKTLPCQER